MNVFLSWSGDRSKIVAKALDQLIRYVIQRSNPWTSEHGIGAGSIWQDVLSEQLNKSQFGILCVTAENQQAPWLLFEAGVLAKQLEKEPLVCPYLIDLNPSDLKPPLSQFQYVEADQQGTLKLILSINHAMGQDALPKDQLEDTFTDRWPRFKKELDELPPPQIQPQQRTLEDMIKETLETVRVLTREAKKDTFAEFVDYLAHPSKSGFVIPMPHIDLDILGLNTLSAQTERDQLLNLMKQFGTERQIPNWSWRVMGAEAPFGASALAPSQEILPSGEEEEKKAPQE